MCTSVEDFISVGSWSRYIVTPMPEIMKTVEDFVSVGSWSWFVATSVIICASLVSLWWSLPRYGRNRGPKIFPIVGCLPQILWNAQRIYDWTTEELQKTPSLTMRSMVPGLAFIETANPVNVEHILKTKFENYPKGPFLCNMFYDLLGLGVFNADGSSWKLQRKVASPEFSRRTLREFALTSMQKETTDRLIPILDSVCDQGSVTDLQDLLLRFSFDTACQIAFGSDPGCLNSELSSAPFAKAFDDIVLLSTNRSWGTFPPWRLQRFLNIGSERKLSQSLKVVDKFALNLISTRRMELAKGEGNQVTSDLLSRFMQIADEFVELPEIKQKIGEDPRSKHVQPSDLFLRDIVTGFLLAGRDTSASGLAWFFWLLSSHREVEDTIYNEIMHILTLRKGERALQDEMFTFEELKNMHYLHGALTESMRLYPPVPEDSKEAAADDIWPDGTRVAKGTVVSYHIYAMGRNESTWGKDCLEFRPDRFLRDGVFVPPSPYEYPVFQAGPRMCLGVDMAFMQMKLVAATLILRYVFALRNGYQARYDLALTMKIVEGLPVYVRHRS